MFQTTNQTIYIGFFLKLGVAPTHPKLEKNCMVSGIPHFRKPRNIRFSVATHWEGRLLFVTWHLRPGTADFPSDLDHTLH